MAEIHLEKNKKGGKAWLWVALLVLVAAGVIAWLVIDGATDDGKEQVSLFGPEAFESRTIGPAVDPRASI